MTEWCKRKKNQISASIAALHSNDLNICIHLQICIYMNASDAKCLKIAQLLL